MLPPRVTLSILAFGTLIVPPTTSGGTATRSLVAIGNDGSTLWSVAL